MISSSDKSGQDAKDRPPAGIAIANQTQDLIISFIKESKLFFPLKQLFNIQTTSDFREKLSLFLHYSNAFTPVFMVYQP